MVNVVIEDDLKTLIDADVGWSITKNTYVFIESHTGALGLDLHHPPVTTGNVKIVIRKSNRTLLSRSLGSETYAFVGIIEMFANTTATMKTGHNELKQIADADPNLLFFFPGIDGDPINEYFVSQILYKWDKYIPH